MKLLTKKIKERAEKQFNLGSDMNQMVVAKFFDPCGNWTWYLMNKDPNDTYCWGIVDGYEVETGSFDISELQNFTNQRGIGIERDKFWTPITANELWNQLMNE